MTLLRQSGETIYHDQVHVARIESLGPLTGIMLEPGSKDDQRLYVINKSNFAIALSTDSALNAQSEPVTLSRSSAKFFTWDMALSKWIKV